MSETIGEYFDKMDLMDIINHNDFYQLNVWHGIQGSPDYWEIMFESNRRNEQGQWLTFLNKPIYDKRYRFYKLRNQTEN